MSTSDLTTTSLSFSNGANVNAQFTASLDTFTLFSTTGANNSVAINNLSSLQFQGTTSGTFTQEANATTTNYSIAWPAAQATVAGQVLANDSTGALSWIAQTTETTSAGDSGDIQFSDGAGAFLASTTSLFRYTDALSSVLNTGVEDGTFTIQGANGDTLAGGNMNLFAGDGGSGIVDGGSVSIHSGDQIVGTGDGGPIELRTGTASGGGTGCTFLLEGGVGADGGDIFATGGLGVATERASILLEGGKAAIGGSIQLAAGDGGVAEDGGNISFITGASAAGVVGIYEFTEAGNAIVQVVNIRGAVENATSTSTGSLRIPGGGGLGVTGDIHSLNYTAAAGGTVNLIGTTSGTFTQEANDNTTSYSVSWPAAQATVAGQVLSNNAAGALSWVAQTAETTSAGDSGDIQFSDGAGAFLASTTSLFRYTDALSSVLNTGVEDGTFTIQGANGSTLSGGSVSVLAGDGGSGIVGGGSVSIQSGGQTVGTGNGGDVTIVSGQGTVDGGSVSLLTGNGNGGDGGALTLQCGTGTISNGVMQFRAPSATNEEFLEIQTNTGVSVVSMFSVSQNATSTSTGSLRVPGGGGIGVSGDVHSANYTAAAGGTVNLIGATSGTFTQEANDSTTSYTVAWPAAQASVAGQVLSNDSAGALSWEDPIIVAGNDGDIQLSDGSGNLKTATPLTFNASIDGTPSLTLSGGASDGVFFIQAVDSTVSGTNGSGLSLNSGDGLGSSGAGGLLYVHAGNAGTSGIGGVVQLLAGNGGSSSGSGGPLLIRGGAGTGFGANGGTVTIEGGNSVASNGGGVLIQTGTSSSTASAGNIQITAGVATGVGGDGGDIILELTSGADNPGAMFFSGSAAASGTDTFFFRDSASTNIVTMPSGVQNATSTSTGSLRIPGGGGLGVTGDIHSLNYTAAAGGTVNLIGTTTGTFTQKANDSTTSYTVAWPAAQATVAGQVLSNDSAGALSWATGASAIGNAGDIQLSDGAGNFTTATAPVVFRYSGDSLVMGEEGVLAHIRGANATTVGSNGGSVSINGGQGEDTSGGGGTVFLFGGEPGNNSAASGGAIRLIAGSGNGLGGGGGDTLIRGGFAAGLGVGGELEMSGGGSNDLSATGATGNTLLITRDISGGVGVAGDVLITAGAATGVGGTAGNLVLQLTSATNLGDMRFVGHSAASAADTFFFQDSALTNILTVPSGVQNATSTSTGSLRVPGGGGIGVTGDIYCNTVNAVSDVRLKSDLSVLESSVCLDLVCAMDPCEYSLRGSPEGVRSCGVVAQELERVPLLQRLVVRGGGDEGSNYAVDYNGLVGILIGAVKQLSDSLNQIKSKLN